LEEKPPVVGGNKSLYDFCKFSIKNKRPSIKDVRTKSRKIDPLPPCPHFSILPPSLCPCEATINFKKFRGFCTKNCGGPHLKSPPPVIRKVSALENPLTAEVLYGRSLRHFCAYFGQKAITQQLKAFKISLKVQISYDNFLSNFRSLPSM